MSTKTCDRPNILFLFADQMRADCIGIQNPRIQTPNLDSLAGRGIVFERTYAPTPVCLPCRAALVSGQYPSSCRATHNQSYLHRTDVPYLPELFAGAGYHTHIIGKSHFQSYHDPCSHEGAPHIHNIEYFRHWHGPWFGFGRADICRGHTTQQHACGLHYGVWLKDQGVEIERFFGHTRYEDYGRWDLPERYHSSKWVADLTIGSITESCKDNRPFFIWANFQDPHNPCMVPAPWSDMYAPQDLPRFGFKEGEPECFTHKPPFYQEIIDQPGSYACRPSDPALPRAGNVSHLDWNQQQVQENAACYYGMVSLMDKYIGKILDVLEENDLLRNTLVVFSSDHGDMLGDHGFWWKSLTWYEEMMRVPLIVSLPGRLPEGIRSGAIQNLIDLPTTFLSLAGLPIPAEYEGIDQFGSWENPQHKTRTDTIVEERPFNTNFNVRVLIEEEYKLVFYSHREYGELYNTLSDPNQINNLWDNPTYSQRKQNMINRILSLEMNRRHPRLSYSERYKYGAYDYMES